MIPTKKLKAVERKAREKCKECDGEGCTTCNHKVARMRRYARSEIPLDFWELSLKSYNGDPKFKEAVAKKIADMDALYEDGGSLAFVGNYGTGKTSVAICILKLAIVKGYTAHYANMSDIIDQVTRSNNDYLDKLINVEFLCLDEYDVRWIYPSDKAERLFGQTMERILRRRFQNKMVTIICSNTPKLESVLAAEFSKSMSSLFSKYVKIYYVGGKDQRKK